MWLGLLGPDGELDVEGYRRLPVEAGRSENSFATFGENAVITGWAVFADSGETIATGGMGQGPINLIPGDTATVVLDLPPEPEPPPKPKREGDPWWERL